MLFFYSPEFDGVGHAAGTRSEEARACLRSTADFVAAMLARAERIYDDVRILGSKGMIRFEAGDVILQTSRRDARKIAPKLPRGYPANPSDNFVKLLTQRVKTNHVPALFGAQDIPSVNTHRA